MPLLPPVLPWPGLATGASSDLPLCPAPRYPRTPHPASATTIPALPPITRALSTPSRPVARATTGALASTLLTTPAAPDTAAQHAAAVPSAQSASARTNPAATTTLSPAARRRRVGARVCSDARDDA